MSDRAVSTVLDAGLAMLLVTAAVVTLLGVPAGPTDDVGTDAADGAADLLGSTTATVNYSLAPGARRADPEVLEFPETALSGPGFRRTAHGTVAGLLATATVGNAGIGGDPFSHATDQLANRSGDLAVSTLERGDVEVQVRSVWRPFPESELRGSLVAGPDPPPDVEVHAATITVAGPVPAARDRVLAAADGGYAAVANALARATVRALFPPERAGLALRGNYPLSALVAYRYRHAARRLGTRVAPAVAEGDARDANERLVAALSDRFEHALRSAYRSPRAAARGTTVGRVTVTVRTWSR